MIDGLPGILNLAAAGGTDLALTSDIVTDGLTGLGLTAKDTGMFVDVMAATCSNSNTSIELMGESLKYVGPVAGTLGITMQDLSVAIGLAGNAGIKGSAAGTALRAGLTNLIKPTDKMAAAMNKYGIELVKNKDGSGNLMKTMENLRSKIGKLDQATQANVLATIFGKEAMSAWASIVNASETDFNKLTDAISNSNGTAQEMSKTMQDNLKGSVDNMKSAFEGVLITIGERLIPIIQNLVDKITSVFTWFNNLSPSIQNIIIAVGGFIAILGPLLLLIGGLIIFAANVTTALGTLSAAFAAGGTAATIFGGALTLLTGPVGLVIAAITGVIAVGYLLIKNWDEICAFASEVWNNIVNAIDNAIGWICDKIGVDWDLVKENLKNIWESIKTNISDAISGVWEVITDTFSSIWNSISDSMSQIKDIIDTTWNFIKVEIFEAIGKAIDALLAGDWEGFKEIISRTVDKIKVAVKNAWESIKDIISNLGDVIKVKIGEAWEAIKNIVKEKVDNIKNSIKTGWNNMKDTIKTGMDNIKKIASTIWEGIKSDIKNKVNGIWTDVKNAFNNIITSISDSLSKAWDTATGWWDKIKGIFKNPIKAVVSIFKKEEKAKSIPVTDPEPISMFNDANDLSNVKFDYYRDKSIVDSSVLDIENTLDKSLKDMKIKFKDSKDIINNNPDINITLNIDKMMNTDNRSIEEIADELAFYLKRKSFA